MTLFKQLFFGASFAFLVVLGATEGVYIKNAHKYLQEQLASHSQDAATSLGMVLPAAMADADLVRVEVTVNAIFDRGYYQTIRVVNATGDTLVLKTLPPAPADVPVWFVNLLPLETPVAESLITKGWRQQGRVVVSSHPNFAYKQLWNTLLEATLSLGALYIISLLALHHFLSRILRPLTDIEHVAHAISERDFQLVKKLPAARELRSVVTAINSMSSKLRAMIDHEVQQANRFRDESNKDVLTGLENRRGFEQKVQSLLNDDNLGSGVLYLLQIDNFQAFNADNGFSKGDELLKALGDALVECSAGQDLLCARINGATFAVAAFNVSKEDSVRLGEALRTSLLAVIEARRDKIQIALGCGGAYFADKKVTLSALLAQCDLSMMQSLADGHSLNVLRDLPDEGENKGSQYWKTLILDSLQAERVVILAQTVLGIKDSLPIQIEVVGRLKNSQGEMIPAGLFIPMANRHELSPALDLAALRKLFGIMKAGTSVANQVAINLSINSIHNQQVNVWLMAVLQDNPSIANRLVFEFTEFGVVQNFVHIENFVKEIRQLGAKFAVDNFGLHHSAFEYLQKLKPSYIKMSQSYIQNLRSNLENQFFISSVVKITHSLDIGVIALGVENKELIGLLRELGVDGYQGFVTGALQELN
jgi:diguanylate cyclase (GGDEF)-like protein